jgi:hypothetical protein
MKKILAILCLILFCRGLASAAGPWTMADEELDKYLPQLAPHLIVLAQGYDDMGCSRDYFFADSDRLNQHDKENLQSLTISLENEIGAHTLSWGNDSFTHDQFRRLVDDRLREKVGAPFPPGRSLNELFADNGFLSWMGPDLARTVGEWRHLRVLHTAADEAREMQARDKLWRLLFKRFGAGHVIVTTCDTD